MFWVIRRKTQVVTDLKVSYEEKERAKLRNTGYTELELDLGHCNLPPGMYIYIKYGDRKSHSVQKEPTAAALQQQIEGYEEILETIFPSTNERVQMKLERTRDELEALKKKIRNKASRSQIDEIIQLLALRKSEVKAFILYFRSIDHNHDGLIRCVLIGFFIGVNRLFG